MLRIRPYKYKDAVALTTWIRDEKEHAFWCANLFDYPLTVEDFESTRIEMDSKDDSIFFTALDKNGTQVGFFSIMHFDYIMNNAHLGFIILDPNYRGQGYGREMVKLAVLYCFNMLSMASITLKVYDNNESAHKCYKAVGFVDISHNDKSPVFKGENWGTWDMIITRRKALKYKAFFKPNI